MLLIEMRIKLHCRKHITGSNNLKNIYVVDFFSYQEKLTFTKHKERQQNDNNNNNVMTYTRKAFRFFSSLTYSRLHKK